MQMAKIFNPVDQSMTVLVNGQAYSVDKSHPNHKELLLAFNEGRLDDFATLTKTSEGTKVYVEKDSQGNKTGLELVDDKVYYNGTELHSTLVDRILGMRREGHKIEYMLEFLRNLMQNPSSRSVNELYDFLTNKNLPITEDGCFLAYKSVCSDYSSKAKDINITLLQGKVVNGGIYNAVGEVIECPRNEVDDERDNECSKGLHVGGLQYSGPNGWYHSRGDKVVIVKINPKDVVSVPKDHNAQKVRVCKYEVIEEYQFVLPEYSTCESYCSCSGEDFYDDYEDEDEEEFDYVDPSVLDGGETVCFDYHGKMRFITVESSNPFNGTVTGLLLMDDPSFNGQQSYRTFQIADMNECQYF
jgi:hypothetical protein